MQNNKPTKLIEISSKKLWGKLGGDDENIDLLRAFFVDKYSRFQDFRDEDTKLAIIRARKGMGKSALLRKVADEKTQNLTPTTNNKHIIIQLKGSDITSSTPINKDNPNAEISNWERRISARIYREIGKTINIALSDDEVVAIQGAESDGIKPRNLIGHFLDRIQLAFKGTSGIGGSLTDKSQEPANPKSFAARLASMQSETLVWIFIDDIDSIYIGSDEQKISIATLLSALRSLTSEIDNLRIRASMRTEVWAEVKRMEAMDKAEEYITDLSWQNNELRQILASRVRTYCNREKIKLPGPYLQNTAEAEISLIELVFEPKLEWTSRSGVEAQKDPHKLMHTLSYGRPRWAIQLARMAAESARKQSRNRISTIDLRNKLSDFGNSRIDDLEREYKHQCERVVAVVRGFHGTKSLFNQTELLEVTTKIAKKIPDLKIDGEPCTDEPLKVAKFLLRIGFILAREDLSYDLYEHMDYDKHYDTLDSMAALLPRPEISWEIHPCFHWALAIK